MKYTLLLLVSLLPSFLCAQSGSCLNELFSDISPVMINFKNETPKEKSLLPYHSIKILDYRIDTSVAGITHFEAFNGNGNYNTKYYRFKTSTVSETEKYIHSFSEFQDTASHQLIMIIRRLWVSSEFENKWINDQDRRMQTAYTGGVRTTFEFYALKQGYFTPLLRYDTTIIDNKMKESEVETYLQQSIKAGIASVSGIDLSEKITKGKKITFDKVDSFSSSFKNIRILSDEKPAKGVYQSYDEFKNNKPGIKDYEIKKMTLADVLYVKDAAGIEIPLRKIWGFSDGERIYIQGANAFFELIRYNDIFDCKGAKKIDMTYRIPRPFRGSGINTGSDLPGFVGGAISQSLRNSSKYKLLVKLLQLDLETGILY